MLTSQSLALGYSSICALIVISQAIGVGTALFIRKRRLGGEYIAGWFVPLLVVAVLALVAFLVIANYPCAGSGCGMGLVILLASTIQLLGVNVVIGIIVQAVLWFILRRKSVKDTETHAPDLA